MMANEMIVIFHHDERGVVRTWSEIGRLVRCKDCKLFGTEECNMRHGFYGIKDDDYCSYGERRTDGTD